MITNNFLNKEYTKYNQENSSWKNGIFHAFVVLIIFLLFQPFGFRDKDLELKLILFPGYGLLAFLYNVSKFYLIRVFLKSKGALTLKNEIACLIVSMFLLVLIIHIFSYWATGDMPLNFQWYIKLYYYTTSLFIIASVIEYLYYNNKSADIHIGDLSSQLQLYAQQIEATRKENTNETIAVSLENGQLTVNREKLVFIESKGNYLEFHLLETDGENKKLIKRGRLHQMEADLENYQEFFRCHRAFIVNLKKIKLIQGNSKNARLILDDRFNEIPVSRSYFKTLTHKLEKITAI